MIELVPASLKHVGPIATRMRAADVEETGAMGRTPKQALRLGLRASVDCMTVLIDGRPEAMLGLTPKNLLEGEGMAWMLGTEAVYGNARAWLHLAPQMLQRWGDSTRRLVGLVGRKNARAIRLLRRLAFEVGEEVTVIGGVEFVAFSLDRENV
jgi:hypothetical protein